MHGRHGLCEHLVMKAGNAGTPNTKDKNSTSQPLRMMQPVHAGFVERLRFHCNDRAQPARAGLAVDGLAGNGAQRLLRKREIDRFHLEQPLMLLHQRVLGLGENELERRLVEVLERGHHRQSADEFVGLAHISKGPPARPHGRFDRPCGPPAPAPMEAILLDTMLDLPSLEGVEEVVISKEVVQGMRGRFTSIADRADRAGDASAS
jgi:hypothetical protein